MCERELYVSTLGNTHILLCKCINNDIQRLGCLFLFFDVNIRVYVTAVMSGRGF